MRLIDIEIVADFMAEDPIERLGVLTFGVSSWVVAVAVDPPTTLIQSLIQILPPLLGIWVAHRSMERAHELRMEKLRRPEPPKVEIFGRVETATPAEDTVDLK